MPQSDTRSTPYMLGRSEEETRRLIRQASLYSPFTRHFLVEAGIVPGMRVLDVGSGAGDVALLAAELVGPHGAVMGVDVNPAVLAVARDRARAAGMTNVTFLQGDLRSLALDTSFDAVIGRLVLMYTGDPAAALREVVSHLRPGGTVAFQDFNLTPESVRFSPSMPLWQQFYSWVRAVAGQVAITDMGFRLRQAFLEAGLPEPQMHLSSPVGGGPDWGGYENAASTLRSMLPLVLKFGVASAEEVDIETLEARLRAETMAHDGIVKLPDLVGAWARLDVPAEQTLNGSLHRELPSDTLIGEVSAFKQGSPMPGDSLVLRSPSSSSSIVSDLAASQ